MLLSACATGYHPEGILGDGYSEEKLGTNRWLVTFAATPFTPRERLEKYLLLRCAEVALANDSRYFVILGSAAEDFHPRATEPNLLDHPEWESHAVQETKQALPTVRRGTAQVVIQTFKQQRPGHPRVYDAQDLIQRLSLATTGL